MAFGVLDMICDTLLLKIFSFLDASSKVSCRAVCRSWRRVASDWRLWRHVDISAISARRAERTTTPEFDNRREALSTSCLATRGLLLEVPLSGRVCSVSLRGCRLNASILAELAEGCPQLHELDLREAYICDSHCPHAPAQARSRHDKRFSSSLRAISLRSASFPPSLLVDLWEMASTAQLIKLDLRSIKPRCTEGRLQCRMQLELLLSSCSSLQLLDISECSWVTDRALVEVMKRTGWSELRSLAMSDCKQFTGTSLRRVLRTCPKLTAINLSGTSLSCQELVRMEPQLWHNVSLESLDLSGCTLTPSAVERTIKPLAASLRHLAMNRWSKATGPVLLKESFHSIMAIVSHGVLRSLELDGHALTSEQVSSFCNSKPGSLDVLLLGLHADVTPETIIRLISSCKQLVHLTLHYSSGINASKWKLLDNIRLSSLHQTSKLETLEIRGPQQAPQSGKTELTPSNLTTSAELVKMKTKVLGTVKGLLEHASGKHVCHAVAGTAACPVSMQIKSLQLFVENLRSVLPGLIELHLVGWTPT